MRTYSHADTVGIFGEFIYREYGQVETIMLNRDTPKIALCFPVRSFNIRATIQIPRRSKLLVPENGTLFSLDNLLSHEEERYVFQTHYFPLKKYIDAQGYLDMEEIEKNTLIFKKYTLDTVFGIKETEELYERAGFLLEKVLGKKTIRYWEDIMKVTSFVYENLGERDYTRFTTTAREILEDLDSFGKYKGKCTEQQTLTTLLLSAGGVLNRKINGDCSIEAGNLAGREYTARSRVLHAWNEFAVSHAERVLWVPLDRGNIPYLRTDSLGIHYIRTRLPQVVASDEDLSEGFFPCQLIMEEFLEKP